MAANEAYANLTGATTEALLTQKLPHDGRLAAVADADHPGHGAGRALPDRRRAAPCPASVGVKLFTGDENDADGILKQADAAMYADKKAGRPDAVAR